MDDDLLNEICGSEPLIKRINVDNEELLGDLELFNISPYSIDYADEVMDDEFEIITKNMFTDMEKDYEKNSSSLETNTSQDSNIILSSCSSYDSINNHTIDYDYFSYPVCDSNNSFCYGINKNFRAELDYNLYNYSHFCYYCGIHYTKHTHVIHNFVPIDVKKVCKTCGLFYFEHKHCNINKSKGEHFYCGVTTLA